MWTESDVWTKRCFHLYIHDNTVTFSVLCRHFHYATQVKDLGSEAIRLAASYPGSNAQAITAQLDEVNAVWESMQNSTLMRKKKLRAALELQKFLSNVSEIFLCLNIDIPWDKRYHICMYVCMPCH